MSWNLTAVLFCGDYRTYTRTSFERAVVLLVAVKFTRDAGKPISVKVRRTPSAFRLAAVVFSMRADGVPAFGLTATRSKAASGFRSTARLTAFYNAC